MNSNDTAEQNFFKGLACFDANDFAKAESFFVRTLELAAGHIPTLNNLAAAQYGQGKISEAALTARSLLKIDEKNLGAYAMLCNCQIAQQDYPAALASCATMIAIDPAGAEPYGKSGYILNLVGRYQESIGFCDRAIELQPRFVEAFLYRGNSLQKLVRHDEALAAYGEALALKPDLFQAWLGRGDSLADLNRHDEALAAYDKALLHNSDLPAAWLGRGNVLGKLRRYEDALVAYDNALAKLDLAPAWLGRGNVLSMLGRHEEAIAAYDRALSTTDMAPAWLGRGNVLGALGRHQEAITAYDRALALNPDLQVGWRGRGYALSMLKRYDEAMLAFDKALALNPGLADAQLGRGNVFSLRGRHEEAIAAYDKALALKPDLAEAQLGRADALFFLKRHAEALTAYDGMLTLKPDLAEAWNGRGNVLSEFKRYDEAFAAFDKALALKPDLADAHTGRGNAFYVLGRWDEALAAYDKALALGPDLAEAWGGRGNVLSELRRYDEAFAAFDKALALKPDLVSAQVGRGYVFYLLGRLDEAMAAYDKALAVRPDMAEAWGGRGNVSISRKRFDEAFFAYDKAFSFNPDLTSVEGARLHCKMHICDWHNLDIERQNLISSVRSHKANTTPFAFLGISRASEDQMKCAQLWISRNYPAKGRDWRGDRYDHDRIRVAYLSADFSDHPVSYLMAGVFEAHDRTRFETIAISLGPDDSGEARKRLVAAFDRFIDVRNRSNEDVASLLKELEIDIAVDLMGHTAGARTAILENRCAPIQVNYLGYPGTMGAGFMDYLISDSTLIPPAQQKDYLEKIAYLPDSYMPNDDSKRIISDRIFERAEFGLPESGFVFCCFNNSYKLTPDVFDGWARILKAVEASVLWLSVANPLAMTNLKKEISARGVDPDRLVFARQVAASADHLARLRLADLFLDTLPYNAHTTASDALWAGLPVLTQIGGTFAGRVAASLLNALGLTELVTHSQGAYETAAIDLATDPARLALIKDKLARSRLSAPLFNTRAFTRNIEAIYAAMHARFQAGFPPDHIRVHQT
jgi:protein O-GlcNAc transferase